MLNNVIYAVILLYAVLYLYKRFRFKNPKNSSLLLSYFFTGPFAIPVHQGLIGDMPYSTFITIHSADSGMALIRVELPFTARAHFLGLPVGMKASGLRPMPWDANYKKERLEGRYEDYFDLYIERGSGADTRYHLDPAAMAFTVDFCRSHAWELIGSELIFLAKNTESTDDPTAMIRDVSEFVENIRPAVEVPLSQKQQRLRTSYSKDDRSDLACPHCEQPFVNVGDKLFRCPNNQGYLLSGALLAEIADRKLRLETSKPTEDSRDSPNSLVCPSSGSSMVKVNYRKAQIDSCSRCEYRWLDMHDLQILQS